MTAEETGEGKEKEMRDDKNDKDTEELVSSWIRDKNWTNYR